MAQIKNIAIIMDGNGRWAKERNRPRVWGHIRGAQTVSKIVEESCAAGLDSLTLYSFSTENWSRPSDEVKNIFKLLKKYLKGERSSMLRNNIRFNVIGNYGVLDTEIVELIDELTSITAGNKGLNLNLAVNYGGRAELLDAINSFVRKNPGQQLREEDISNSLYNPGVKDIDLLIRTAGDQRISNFLLWQVSYAEFVFTDTKWPEFTVDEYKKILDKAGLRDRRFGSIDNNANQDDIKKVAKTNMKLLKRLK